jgi:hypothetical protein
MCPAERRRTRAAHIAILTDGSAGTVAHDVMVRTHAAGSRNARRNPDPRRRRLQLTPGRRVERSLTGAVAPASAGTELLLEVEHALVAARSGRVREAVPLVEASRRDVALVDADFEELGPARPALPRSRRTLALPMP